MIFVLKLWRQLLGVLDVAAFSTMAGYVNETVIILRISCARCLHFYRSIGRPPTLKNGFVYDSILILNLISGNVCTKVWIVSWYAQSCAFIPLS